MSGLACCRAVLDLPKWQKSGGRDFVFYHSHPDFKLSNTEETDAFLGTICGSFQWATMVGTLPVQQH